MNLRTSQPSKPGPVKPDPGHPARTSLGRVVALAFFVLHGVGAIDGAAAQSRALPVKPFVQTQNAGFVPPTIHSATANDVIHLTVGRSAVLNSAVPLRRVFIGNPAVLSSYCSGTAEIVLTAKTAGVSSMVLWDEAGSHRLYTVSADIDPDALRGSFDAAFPGSSIHVDTGEGKIFLTGSVASDAASDAALKMASLYAKDVVNSLVVVPVHGKQVQLKLRIVEVDRTRLNQFGVNIFSPGIGNTLGSTSTQQYGTTATGSGSSLTVSDPLNIFLYNSKLNVGVTVQDLEQKQILQVLAEPTLTTLSGLPASFLSGGEFPFPVVQGGTGNSTAISIQFRSFGVKVDFTPTVNPDGSIRIKLSPEVSTLDYSNAVTISGFTIPALSTRRAETQVEIQNGQSFIVSGLLDHRTTEIMSKMPGISSIPILGDLFRSKNFNHSVVELVIIVTATVVDPLTSSPQAVPEQPKMAVPNLDSSAFDGKAHNLPKASVWAPAPQSKPLAQTQSKPLAQPQSKPLAQPQSKPLAQTQSKPLAQTQSKPLAQTQSKPLAQPQSKPLAQTQSKPLAQTQSKPPAQTQSKPLAQTQSKPLAQTQSKPPAQTHPPQPASQVRTDYP
ncbi:MAG: pilus assembly protein N-terminal domain-containing protein [Acidobacteriaceae bacterium]